MQSATESSWALLSRHPTTRLSKNDRTLLDFGCGVGRFSQRLAELGLQVTGADISTHMLAMARKQCRNASCRFALIKPGESLPWQSHSFDALLTFTVLQHVPDHVFPDLAQELIRVLAPDGLLLLFENTHQYKHRLSGSGHVVFRSAQEYLEAFPGITVSKQLNIEGEEHTLFVGRVAHDKSTDNFNAKTALPLSLAS